MLAMPDAVTAVTRCGMTRQARRRMVPSSSVAAVAIVVLGAAGAVAHIQEARPVQQLSAAAADVSAAITGKPPVVASKCATPTTFTFTGSVTDHEAGTGVLPVAVLHGEERPGRDG